VSALRPKEAQLRAAVKDLLSPLGRPEPWDLGAAVLGLPMLVSRMLLGLPADDLPELVRWGMMTVAPDDPEFQVGGPEATLHVAHQELFAYFANELDRRDGQVRDDLIGRLMTAVVDGARMRHGEIIANCYSILLGANVNTGHVITAALLELRDDHAQYAAWAEHPQRRRAIEEALRWASPVVHFMRYTTAEVTIRGVRIPKGDPVVAWIASANRDPEVFDRPFRFDIDRRPNQHIAFGDGAHYCIGAATARLTLQIAMEEILRQVESFDYIGAAEHLHSNFTGGIKHLRVVARPRRS
jgi:cytochrome P450